MATKLVFLTSALLRAPLSGAALRDQGILSALPPSLPVQRIYVGPPGVEPAPMAQGDVFVARERRPWAFRAAGLVRPYVANGFSRKVTDTLASLYEPGAVLWVSRLALAQYIRPAKAMGYRVILDQHNVESDYYLAAVRRSKRWHEWPLARQLRRWEKRFCRQADCVVVTSPQDASRLRDLAGVNCPVVPNCVRAPEITADAAGGTLLFVGSLDYAPNVEGALWFIEKVWPLVKSGTRLRIVGARPAPNLVERLRSAGAEVVPNAPELDSHYAAAALCIAPILSGGGTRIKILEALAREKCVVSTSKGAEGLGLVPNRELLLADQPADFAAEINRALDDGELRARTGKRGRQSVLAHYTWPAQASRLQALISGNFSQQNHAADNAHH